jgi:hypothetical protein
VTVIALLASIVLGTASLAWGFAVVGLTQVSRWLIVLGVVWLVAVWQRWRWFAYVGVSGAFLMAAVGLWFLNLPPGWMFGGAILGLAAWDLTNFRYRQRFAASDEERRPIERRHLLRLTFVALIGFGLAHAAMLVKRQLSFEWIVFLAIVVALGLSQILRWFRSQWWTTGAD